MTYTPDIPKPTDNISTSQGQLRTNFNQLENIFSNDHYTWDDPTSGGAYRGYHKQVYFPVASASNPSLGSFASVFFSKNDPNDASSRPQLYFKNVTETLQVTNRFHSAVTNGYVMLPGGIILMWGFVANPGSGNHSQIFNVIANYTGGPAGFPNNCFNVQLTLNGTSSGTQNTILDQGNPFTKDEFFYRMSASGPDFYWFAIGN